LRADRRVEVVEQVAQRVGPPFLVSGGVVREGSGGRMELRRVAKHVAVRAVAAADPQTVRLLLIPHEARLAGIDLKGKVVLPAGAHLTHGE
jgi:imidazole glycerol phosphate synthase subunit HisF